MYETKGQEGRLERMADSLGVTKRAFLLIIGLSLCVLLLLITAITFTALYFSVIPSGQGIANDNLADWPAPTGSLLGTYAKAAVAADNTLCSGIGRDILLAGGNAVDAAIAALFCIGVTDTHSAGIGGGHFMTIYNANTQRCHVIDAREAAPLAASENMYQDRWNYSKFGWEAVAVPGELHGLWTEFKQFGSGKVRWSALIEPTVRLLEYGYPTSHALAKALADHADQVLAEPTLRSRFVNPQTNKLYRAGEQITTRKNFAETLREIAKAEDPVKSFYEGELTNRFLEEFQKNGGIMTREDFSKYRAIVRPDSEVVYTHLSSGKTICGPPPPSGAAVTQAILNVLDKTSFNMTSSASTVDMLHRFIEASKFGFAVRESLGDVAFVKEAMQIAKRVTSAEWADMVRSKITDKTHPDAYYGGEAVEPLNDHGTTHISVIDKDGNAVAVTSTINLQFGAMVMSDSTGVLWNNEMDDFSSPGHPNYWKLPPSPANFIRPEKRPMSSQSPIIIFDKNDKTEVMSIGGAGGSHIISAVANAVLQTNWLGRNVKQAIDFPRVHNQLRPNLTFVEEGTAHFIPQPYLDALRRRDHQFSANTEGTVLTAVYRAKDGVVYANSDFRKSYESEPAGY